MLTASRRRGAEIEVQPSGGWQLGQLPRSQARKTGGTRLSTGIWAVVGLRTELSLLGETMIPSLIHLRVAQMWDSPSGTGARPETEGLVTACDDAKDDSTC